MKFFFAFMLLGFAVSLYFLLTDGEGSGMGWGVLVFGVLGVGVAIYNHIRYGSAFREGPTNNL